MKDDAEIVIERIAPRECHFDPVTGEPIALTPIVEIGRYEFARRYGVVLGVGFERKTLVEPTD